jgi:ketosteroid isomerase-like protein
MNDAKSQPATSNDELEIRKLIEQWAKAVREENRAAIRADHDPNILMLDVPPPFLSRGLDDYMATWENFFRHLKDLWFLLFTMCRSLVARTLLSRRQ